MTSLTLIQRSLAHHRRAHTAAVLAALVATAVLTGALLVGDSVRYSLRSMALERLGRTDIALVGGDRFFGQDLGERMLKNAPQTLAHAAPLILVEGICIADKSNQRANQVQINGVTPEFWRMNAELAAALELKAGECALNERLAAALNAKVDEPVRVRISKPGFVPHDAPLGSKEDHSALLRCKVKSILPDRGIGRFSLRANQVAPLNIFLPIADLQGKLEQKSRANLLLLSQQESLGSKALEAAEAALQNVWSLDDGQLKLRSEEKLKFAELSTPRVFLGEPVSDAVLAVSSAEAGAPSPLTTYFVNAIRANGRETPYSMTTAADARVLGMELKDDEIALNTWTADDLQAKVGDKVELEFFVAGLMRKLSTQKASFTLKAIVPMEGVFADRHLMPDFPGIADVDTTHEWDSSIPIDMKKIRDKDENYWKQFRGTPKAFISRNAGVKLWSNRFGTDTALRFPLTGDVKNASAELETKIRQSLTPAKAGLSLLAVRELAARASGEAMDFGGLFIGFSFFLIVAALLLLALVFRFNVESRGAEIGVLLAVGFPPQRVRRLLLIEGLALAAVGALAGVFLGSFYAQTMLTSLATRWRDAVGTSSLLYHGEPLTLLIGGVCGVAFAGVAIALALRGAAKQNARELLAARGAEAPAQGNAKRSLRWGSLLVIAAVALVLLSATKDGAAAAGIFFGAGALLLTGTLILARWQLARATGSLAGGAGASALARLGVRGASRRVGRSVATAALLASGSFLLIAVAANQLDASANASDRGSGTGGFLLYAESTLAVYDDLNTPAGRESAGVSDKAVAGATIFALRMKPGDEASCLNLNRAQQPRILGVPDALVERGGFTFVAGDAAKGWKLLEESGDSIPAIGDFQSLTWALGKKVGDEIPVNDEAGRSRRLRISGAVANSILQGSLLISERDFLKLFPSESGYRVFLIDAPEERSAELQRSLSQALQDEGLTIIPATKRLAEFNAVQNTYLSTFQALGGFGLLLGSLGLGIVVLRNVLERRAELAVLRAVGFSRRQIAWLVLSEHAWLLLLGMGCGVFAALVAVVPALRSSTVPFPWADLIKTLGACIACGMLSVIIATWGSLRTPLLEALRSE